jgi:hypothetical protein
MNTYTKTPGGRVCALALVAATFRRRRARSGSVLAPWLTRDQHPAKYRFLLRTPDRSSHPTCRGVIQVNLSAACELRRDLALSSNDNAWAIRNPLDEARDLHKMTVYGSCTVESIRELISVPPEIEAALLAYADRYPKDGDRIRCVLQFRRKVGVEFERLLHGDMSFIEAQPNDVEAQPDADEDISDAESAVPVLASIEASIEL